MGHFKIKNYKFGKILYKGESFAPYGVMSCTCGLNYFSPRLKEEIVLANYAKDQYFLGQTNGYADYATQKTALRAMFRKLLRTLAKQLP